MHPSVAEIVAALAADLGVQPGPVLIEGADPVTASPHRLGDASASAIALFGQQIAGIAGISEVVGVRVEDAIDQLRAGFLTTVNGHSAEHLSEDPSGWRNCDFYQARDGRWIFLWTYGPHERDAVCRVLDCPPLRNRIAESVREWDAFPLEDAICQVGGIAAVARSAAEWRSSAVGRVSMAQPVIRLDRIGDAEPRPLPHGDRWPPLSGFRVLDLTHVIAGPMAGKLLATFGANVLHVSRPDKPDRYESVARTGGGKRNAHCDLREPAQADQLRDLCSGADVFVNNYRGMAERGFDAATLAERASGIIVLEYHCWGLDGPWAHRGGYDHLACSATGFSHAEGWGAAPSLPPTGLLNDYLSAYLGASGVLAALRRRAVEGGNWRVRVELARVCTWVQELGTFAPEWIRGRPPLGAPTIAMHTTSGPFGTTVEPVVPLSFGTLPTPAPQPATLLGTAPLQW